MRLLILTSSLLCAVLFSGCPKGAEYAGRLAGVAAEDLPQMPQTWNAWFGRTLREHKPGGLEVMQARTLAAEARAAMMAYFTAYNRLPEHTAQIENLILHRVRGANGEVLPLVNLQAGEALQPGTVGLVMAGGEVSVLIPAREPAAGKAFYSAKENVQRLLDGFGPMQPGRAQMPSEQAFADYIYRRCLNQATLTLTQNYIMAMGSFPESWGQMLDAFSLVSAGYSPSAPGASRPSSFSHLAFEAYISQSDSALAYRSSDLLPDWDGDGWPDWDWSAYRFDINSASSQVGCRFLQDAEYSQDQVAQLPVLLRIFSERRPLEQLLPETGTPQSLREAQPDAAPAATLANAARE